MVATMPSADWPSVLRSWSGGLPIAQAAPDPALLAGIAAYRSHRFERQVQEPPTVWQEGSSRLLDYGPPDGAPLLVVPSLINRAYILDLLPGHSMLRFLAAGGVRPLLLDWGYPDAAERGFSLTDLVAGRLSRALDSLDGKLGVAGYCMGGLMAVAAAQLRPEKIDRLVLLATPWDFWAPGKAASRKLARLLPLLEPAMAQTGALPTDMLQILFSLLDPGAVGDKYRAFGASDLGSPRATMFVALEDWLNDGVPLAAPIARDVLSHWYGANAPSRGAWRILGQPVLPETLAIRCLVAVPGRDRIVPPESARALADRIPGADMLILPAGHVGMVAGSSAQTLLWTKLLRWLQA
jgi:poly(3-hydroxyalkanoate) synthetase